MSNRVDEPGEVEVEHVAEEGSEAEGGHQRLSPEEPRDEGGQDDAHGQDQLDIMLLLEHDNGVRLQVAHVNLLAVLLDCRCFLQRSHPMWAKKRPRLTLCGSAWVSAYVWCTR